MVGWERGVKGSLKDEGRERGEGARRERGKSRSRRGGLTAKLGGKQMVGWQTKKQSKERGVSDSWRG